MTPSPRARRAIIGVLCGGGTAAQLRAAGSVALYKDPADLLMNYDALPLASGGARRTGGNHGTKEKSMNSTNTFYFLMGLGLGVAAGILFAPKSGDETRGFLKSKSEEGATYARQTASDAIDHAKHKAEDLKKTAAETLDNATQAVKATTKA